MMAHARSRGRARRPGNNMPHHGWLIFNRPERHWFFRLLGMIVRARAELTLITVTVTVYLQATHYYDPQAVLIGMGVVRSRCSRYRRPAATCGDASGV